MDRDTGLAESQGQLGPCLSLAWASPGVVICSVEAGRVGRQNSPRPSAGARVGTSPSIAFPPSTLTSSINVGAIIIKQSGESFIPTF